MKKIIITSEQEKNIIYYALCDKFLDDIGNIAKEYKKEADILIINNLLAKYEPDYYKKK